MTHPTTQAHVAMLRALEPYLASWQIARLEEIFVKTGKHAGVAIHEILRGKEFDKLLARH